MESRTAKRAVAAVALAATLTGGAVVGAVLGTPTTSGAQSPTSDSTTTAPSTTSPNTEGSEERPGPPDGHGGPFGFKSFDLSAAADALGLTEDELRTRLEGGDTIAEIADAEGVDVAKVIDALVAAGQKAIDEAAADAKANLEERITGLVNDGFPERGAPGGRGEHMRFGFADLSVAAKALGLTEDELRTRIESGDTLAEVAKAEGVSVDTVVAALVKEASAHIDEEVAEGDLTKDEATTLKASLEERIRTLVEDGGPFGRGGPFGHGHP